MRQSSVEINDMCKGPLLKKMFIFALPIMAMNLLQLLFNAADMIVVGRFSGKEALAAVGSTGALINLIINTFMGLSVGTSVIVAQDYGAHNYDGVEKAVHTSIAISAIGGLAVMIIGLVFCKPALRLMGTPDDIINLATKYMLIYFIGVPANMIYNFAAAVQRAVGDSKHPMYYLIISGIVNVIMNLFFVVVLKMNVAGVAWATVISQYLSVAMILACLMRTDDATALRLKKLCIDKFKVVSIVKVGLPAGLQSALFSISNILIQSAINSFGSALVAANSASGNIEGFVGTTMNAYYNAAITFTGQNMGAKKYSRIDRIALITTLFIVTTWISIGGLVLIFGRQLMGIYSDDSEVIRLGIERLKIMMYAYISCGIMNVFPGLTRGMGYSILPMLCTLVGACLIRIVWLMTIFTWYHTTFILFLCYPVTWTLAGLGQVASFFYARKKIRAHGDMIADD